ncbi:MAG: DUF6456 domain-containing protein [Pseudomonadota bacterium]
MMKSTMRALRLLSTRTVALDADGGAHLRAGGSEANLSPKDVVQLASDDLVAVDDGMMRRTAAGAAALRRALVEGDGFAAQHREMETRAIVDAGAVVTVAANAAESPLAFLARRKDGRGRPLVNRVQRQAGERLASDHRRGHAGPSVTQSWDASGVRGGKRRDGLSVSEGASAARRRVMGALGAVGPGLADVLVAVCCDELGIEAAEKRLGWPARSGKLVLGLALDRLASHYGLGHAMRGTGERMVHWGDATYRPTA